MASEARSQWGSKLGFILAASGSAIGLGNIIFFGANAYRFGGGAFYLPYFISLFVLGIPMMIVEIGLGKSERRALPEAMFRTTGKKGEFWAWFSLVNALIIAMYYMVILAWAAGMFIKSVGPLFEEGVGATFVGIMQSWLPALLVVAVWGLNVAVLIRGTQTIERVVKIFVPLMWIFMIVLVFRGLTLDNGAQGIWYLFTPNFEGVKSPSVWQGAFSQMFFSLSLGLGALTAYASYLPAKSDVVANSSMISFLNCSFELVAGVAIFTILFAFSLHPSATTGTVGMSLVVIPIGIGQFPAWQSVFASIFFLLLLVAGLTSSISIVEGPVAAIRDKFGWSRKRVLFIVAGLGVLGSLFFALPMVMTQDGKESQTLGLSFIELIDHWSFGYSLLLVGLAEAIFIGWVYGIAKLRARINEHSRIQIGPSFDILIKWVVPGLIGAVLLFNIAVELGLVENALGQTGFYKGDSGTMDGLGWLPLACFLLWLVAGFGGATWLTWKGAYPAKKSDEAISGAGQL